MNEREKNMYSGVEEYKNTEVYDINSKNFENEFEKSGNDFENQFKKDVIKDGQNEFESKFMKKMEITYNAINNTYYVDGKPYATVVYDKKEQEEITERLVNEINAKNKINLFEKVKNHKKTLESIDPTVLAIINSKMGRTGAKKYIAALEKGNLNNEIDLERLDFSLKYNLTGMERNDNLSFKNERDIIALAKKSAGFAEIEKNKVKPEKNVIRKNSFMKRASIALSTLVAGISLIGFAAGSKANQKALNPGEINQVSAQSNDDLEFKIEKNDAKAPSIQNDFRESIKVENLQEEKKENEYTLGDVVYLDEGCNYYENSIEGGEHNTIDTNNQWRKSGDYMLDGLAVTYKDTEGKWKVAKSMDDESNGGNYGSLGLNSKEYIQKIMQEKGLTQDQVRVMYHINQGKIQGEHPTGWIEAPEEGFKVESKYENQQKIQEENDNQR